MYKQLCETMAGHHSWVRFSAGLDSEICIACETCIDRCPMDALEMGEDEVPEVNLDRCIGCGV